MSELPDFVQRARALFNEVSALEPLFDKHVEALRAYMETDPESKVAIKNLTPLNELIGFCFAVAADYAGTYCWNRSTDGDQFKHPAVFTTHTWQHIREGLLSLAPDAIKDYNALLKKIEKGGENE